MRRAREQCLCAALASGGGRIELVSQSVRGGDPSRACQTLGSKPHTGGSSEDRIPYRGRDADDFGPREPLR